ncbi:MAG: hypothetical protein AAB785_02580, partial [Patescibacteria group bacterium]
MEILFKFSKGGVIKNFLKRVLVVIFFISFLAWPLESAHAGTLWQQVGGMGLGDADNTIITNM